MYQWNIKLSLRRHLHRRHLHRHHSKDTRHLLSGDAIGARVNATVSKALKTTTNPSTRNWPKTFAILARMCSILTLISSCTGGVRGYGKNRKKSAALAANKKKKKKAAKVAAGWLPTGSESYPEVSHVGFGSTEVVVKLAELFDEAKTLCLVAFIERGKGDEWTAGELEQSAEAVGYGAVKYADLNNNRLTNYTFNFDQMLNDKIQTQSCQQVLDEAEREYKKMSGEINEGRDAMKASYAEFMAEAQASAARLCKTSIPAISESVEKALSSLTCRYGVSANLVR